jgi:hypothetical protein
MEPNSDPNQHQYVCEVIIPIVLKIPLYIEPIVLEMPPTCVSQERSTELFAQNREAVTPQLSFQLTTESQQIQLTEPLQIQLTEYLQTKLTESLQIQLTEPLQVQLTQPLQVQSTKSSQVQPTEILQFQPTEPLQVQFIATSLQTSLTDPQQLQLTTTSTKYPLKHKLLLPRMTVWQLLIASLLSISLLLLIAQGRLSTGILPYIQTLQIFHDSAY